MILNDSKHLNAIHELAATIINASLHNREYFASKDEFVNQLDLFLAQETQPTEIRVKGYRVKFTYLGSAESSAQQKILKDIVLSSLRRMGEADSFFKINSILIKRSIKIC
jgi:hypothetical protein